MNEMDAVDDNVCPFKLEWAIGRNWEVGVVNLTTRKRSLIAYACSHVVILYDYSSKDMMSLQGHTNAVRTLSASRDGKWLLSADYDQDSVCIVWDTETRVPICSLFNPHGECFLTAASLSPNAKYLITVGNEDVQVVNLWLWTSGKKAPDASVELTETTGDRVKKISFNDDYPREFFLTLNDNVFFVTWNREGILEAERPKIPQRTRHSSGIFNDSCYVSKSHRVMTVTTNGFVLVWETATQNGKSTNGVKKGLIKSVPLQKANLTCIEKHEKVIVIGNDSGRLYFYDDQLRLLYWCKDCHFDSIVSISFDRDSNLKRPENSPSVSTISQSKSIEEILATTDEEEISKSSTSEVEIDHEKTPKENSPDTKKIEVFPSGVHNKNTPAEPTKNFTSSTITIDIDYVTSKSMKGKFLEPSDCTLEGAFFAVPIFFVSSVSGKIGRLDIAKLKCRFVAHPVEAAVTAIAARPQSDYVVTGDNLGNLCLYKYTTRSRMVTKKTPAVPNLKKLLKFEAGNLDTTYVTRPQIHESIVGVSTLKFSPTKDGMLACGLKSGLIWILHPDTLDPIDPNPYKHSSSSITDIIFTNSGEYLAYSDDLFTVGVFRKRLTTSPNDENQWNFLGKYHSHCAPIREILFLKPAVGKISPRLLSIGEDRNLVEYDLENSGPYPEPGLKILHANKVERYAVPLCMADYPDFGVETFLITANSEYKFRLINDYTKAIRKTFLGPTLGEPVQRIHITNKIQTEGKNRGYMIFTTSKEIGLVVLPFDGNPYKIVAMIAHPKKITCTATSDCGKYLFTLGENDHGVFMWKINYKSVDMMERLGGEGLTPFSSLIEGGRDGWLVNEMEDLFYYAQILQQGENTTATRIVGAKVSIMQLPNLMRAVGFYPTNAELETMMEEVSYKHYAETGRLVEEMSFDDFVKLYVNHRPAFGITKTQIRQAFQVFAKPEDLLNPTLSSRQFLEVLYGRGDGNPSANDSGRKLCGEPLSNEEAHTYLRRLVPQDDDTMSYSGSRDEKDLKTELTFDFLPPTISYKSFIDEILGIGNSEKSPTLKSPRLNIPKKENNPTQTL